MGLLDDGVAMLVQHLRDNTAKSMTYRRGASAVNVHLTRGRTEYSTYDDEGNLVTEVTDVTFLCRSSDLILDGQVIDPEPGDTVEDRAGDGSLLVYEVMARGTLRPFRRDASGQLLRINAKLIETR